MRMCPYAKLKAGLVTVLALQLRLNTHSWQ